MYKKQNKLFLSFTLEIYSIFTNWTYELWKNKFSINLEQINRLTSEFTEITFFFLKSRNSSLFLNLNGEDGLPNKSKNHKSFTLILENRKKNSLRID